MSLKSDSSSLHSIAHRIDYIASITERCGVILGMRIGPTSLIIIGHDRVFALVRYVLENIHTIDLSIADLETLSHSLRELSSATTISQINTAIAVAMYTLKLTTEADLKAYMDTLMFAADSVLDVHYMPEARLILLNETDAGKPKTSAKISEEYKVNVAH